MQQPDKIHFLHLTYEIVQTRNTKSQSVAIDKRHAGIEPDKISEEPVSSLQAYLKKMRQHSSSVPDLNEITQMVEEVRSERYAKK